MESRQIHLVRHGITIWNQERRFQGHIDVPLSDEGVRQAAATAQRLQTFSIARCHSSDLARALETARPIAQTLGIDPCLDTDLREANKGELEGKYRDPDTGLLGDESHVHDDNDLAVRPPGGESMIDLAERSGAFLERLRQDLNDTLPPGDILLVSHGGTMRTMLANLLDLPVEASRSFHFDNCSLTTVLLRPDAPALLTRYNDMAHLTS